MGKRSDPLATTDRRKHKGERRSDDLMMHQLVQDIDVGILAVDLDRKVTFCNKALAAFVGTAPHQILRQRCCDIICGLFGLQECLLEQTLATGKTIVNKLLPLHDDANMTSPISINTALLYDPAESLKGAVLTIRDMGAAGEFYEYPLHLWITAQMMQDTNRIRDYRRQKIERHSFKGIISASPQMQEIFALLPRIADSDSTILIEGPSGSGKELIAHTIHSLSPRKSRPIISVNSGALPETLIESELFGYKAGAFTDARKDKPGRIALAEGGTLFLDEIGDITPALQVRLLRFLQSREYEPLGATRQLRANVRIIAATHRNLEQMVREGRFREDLYYRINVYKVVVPPLCQRKEDIPLLVDHIIDQFNAEKKRSIKGVSADAHAMLLNYAFPGNVRELQNIIEHAYILCIDDYIRPEHLPATLQTENQQRLQDMRTTLETLEEITILEALKRHKHNRVAAARELGIHKTTLWRKMKLLGLKGIS